MEYAQQWIKAALIDHSLCKYRLMQQLYVNYTILKKILFYFRF